MRAESPVYGGYAIGRDGKVVFIRGAIPGELVEVAIEEKKKDYSIATARNILEPSPSRREAPCRVFGLCGGCQLQFVEYEGQVSMKEEIIRDTMRRIGGLDVQLLPPLTDREFRYRHRAQFKVSPKGEVGFYREGTRDILRIEECPVMVDEINGALRELRGIGLTGLKEISVIFGDTLAAIVKGDVTDELVQGVLDAEIAGIAFENGDSQGKDYITLDLNGLKYSVTPWSFFQSHWSLNRKVVETVVERLAPLSGKKVLDLYAGAGNFALPLSVGAEEVIAVEENRFAAEDGKRNAMLNGIKNCRFIGLSAEKSLERGGKRRGEKLLGESSYDIVVLNPPRPGLTRDCLKKVLDLGAKKVVYLSCNPATLARDLKKMNDRYDLESLALIDFFPNTYHIESLAFLNLR
ncbi:MAG TPA: class I SAM-dependent RNA methyltransferase [Thermodesulfovibrionales bacterium]|nr:class I SAM-dependent RNA methyltransferase [Thermodesulfovibrionales bacterium]